MNPRNSRRLLLLSLALATPCATAEDFTSIGDGIWHSTNPNIWSPAGNPLPGAGDNVIVNGHTVVFGNNLGGATAGLSGSNDLGISNGNRIDINNGGVLSQQQTGWWTRIGHSGLGTLNINDGRFHFTDGTGGGSSLQVGVQNAGAEGRINIGDGTGAAGSAVLNLRHRINGEETGGSNDMNLGASTNTFGLVTVNSDGLLEGDAITRSGGGITQNPHIRVGQSSSTFESVLRVNAGGQVNVRGNLEVGAGGGSQGLIHLTGAGARFDQYDGEFTLGFNGTGDLLIEDGATYTRHNTTDQRMDLYLGRQTGTGTLTIGDGGEFIQGAGGNVGDLRIGFGNGATGILNVQAGGVFRNDSGNWNWVGQNTGSTGTINVNGGDYLITTGSNLNIGLNGNGNFHQTSGNTNVNGVILAEGSGTADFELNDGTFTARAGFLMGGANPGSGGTGSATGLQTGGTMTVAGAFVVGLASGHTGSYDLDGGLFNHTGSDISVGESGSGTLTIGTGATLNDTSATGAFFVGRNENSSGTLWVDGTLIHTSSNAIRVGNGNTGGVDNTNGTGLVGGIGTIQSTAGGIVIGSQGTLTGGNLTSTGMLGIEGNLGFSSGGEFFVNVDAGGASDRINLTGSLDITNALLVGAVSGGPVTPGTLYWLVVNDGVDAITGSFSNLSGTSEHAAAYPAADGWVTLDGEEFAVFYGGDFATQSLTGGNDLVIAAVPEPGSLALAGFASALVMLRRRRQK